MRCLLLCQVVVQCAVFVLVVVSTSLHESTNRVSSMGGDMHAINALLVSVEALAAVSNHYVTRVKTGHGPIPCTLAQHMTKHVVMPITVLAACTTPQLAHTSTVQK